MEQIQRQKNLENQQTSEQGHDYTIANDNSRIQLPTFYPDESHYIFHKPQQFAQSYGQGVAQTRDLTFDGSSSPENVPGLERGSISSATFNRDEDKKARITSPAPIPTNELINRLKNQQISLVAAQVSEEPAVVSKPRFGTLSAWVKTFIMTLAVFGGFYLFSTLGKKKK